MEFTAKQISELLEGEVIGDENAVVSNLSKIEEGKPGTLSFLANPQYTSHIYTTSASIVIVNKSFKAEGEISATLVAVEDAYASFAKLLEVYNSMQHAVEGIHENSFIHDSATYGEDIFVDAFTSIGKNVTIGKNVKIYAQVSIGDNVTIGDDCILYAGVKIYHDCSIGAKVTLHSGVIIGGDGFGFAPNADNQYNKVAQIGNVIIEEGVEVGANSTIDRATLGSTIIRQGVKIDNLIQIAHNVEIGKNTVIAAQTGIAGSTKIGADCMIGGQVGIAGHIVIGNGVKIAAQSGISSDLKDKSVVMGSPAFNIGDYNRSYVYFKKLPSLFSKK